jgi:pheromone shutdown-related protein TraB
MLKIIGTSHISRESIQEITQIVENWQPELIAVELDVQRAQALLSEEKNKVTISDILKIGIKGFVFVKIGQYVQEKLGKMVGVKPGSDMKTALLLGKKKKIDVALIDQPIQLTLRNLSRRLTWKERGRFIGDIIMGLLRPRKQMQSLGLEKLDLRKVPGKEVIVVMMKQLQKRYPSVYTSLVSDRNKYMVKKLVRLLRKYPGKKILVVVGAGHKEGMEKLLLKVEVL